MTRLIVDEKLRAQLKGLSGELEFRDESGRNLGRFLPAEQYSALVYCRERDHLSDEEVERARQQPGGRSLKEIWTRLRQA